MIINNVNVEKLHSEMMAAGLNPYPVINRGSGTGEFIFKPDVDIVLLQKVIDAHSPTPTPSPLTDIEQLRLDMARSNAEMFETMLSLMGGM